MTPPIPNVVIGFLGGTLDAVGTPREKRWSRWRPTVDLFQHSECPIARIDLIISRRLWKLYELTRKDILALSPTTEVVPHELSFRDPWDFEEVYETLYRWVRAYPFRPDHERYLLHITTGTHVAQICWFLLAEARQAPAQLIQGSPAKEDRSKPGSYRIIDLDLSRYDKIARRFAVEKHDHISFLKAGIDTRNTAFNRLIEEIELVAMRSSEPILLEGPTGTGKSQLARRIYDLKREQRLVKGALVEVNCATLRGDNAMSTLFGHIKGAYTGALTDRPGLLKAAHDGVLFLDEIGELGLDEQAMLLRALEDKTFLPVGSDKPTRSDFALLAGTNRSLAQRVHSGQFREDLLARINLWSFRMPSLAERPEDIEPNLDYELRRWEEKNGQRLTINHEAREKFLEFSRSAEARWTGNFRDFNAAVTRMGVLCEGLRIDEQIVETELARLRQRWERPKTDKTPKDDFLRSLLGEEKLEQLDRFDRVQLADVVSVCRESHSLSDAGRKLFAASRSKKVVVNDADRLRKYLARFELTFDSVSLKTRPGLCQPPSAP
jgi:transcriptional regulatory protein RtcR